MKLLKIIAILSFCFGLLGCGARNFDSDKKYGTNPNAPRNFPPPGQTGYGVLMLQSDIVWGEMAEIDVALGSTNGSKRLKFYFSNLDAKVYSTWSGKSVGEWSCANSVVNCGLINLVIRKASEKNSYFGFSQDLYVSLQKVASYDLYIAESPVSTGDLVKLRFSLDAEEGQFIEVLNLNILTPLATFKQHVTYSALRHYKGFYLNKALQVRLLTNEKIGDEYLFDSKLDFTSDLSNVWQVVPDVVEGTIQPNESSEKYIPFQLRLQQ